MSFQEDCVKAELLLHDRIREHWRSLGSVEKLRRKQLMDEAQRLLNSIGRRAMTFKPIDPVQYERSMAAFHQAIERHHRRSVAYHGE